MVNWSLIGALVLPTVGGWASSLSMIGQVKSPNGTAWYETLKKPSWTPPNWLFAPIWIVLYTTMGYASYLIYNDFGGFTCGAMIPLALYGVQLLLNWTWTPVFFKLHMMGLAFIHMLALDCITLACTVSFYYINQIAAILLIPYLGWLAFASCLNYTFWQLNRDEIKSVKF